MNSKRAITCQHQTEQQHSDSADQQSDSSPEPESKVRRLPKFNADFLVQKYIYDKIFTKMRPVFPANWKMSHLAILKNTSEEFLHLIQKQTNSKINKFFLVYRYPVPLTPGKVVIKVRSAFFA